jgi:hypothetical protein
MPNLAPARPARLLRWLLPATLLAFAIFLAAPALARSPAIHVSPTTVHAGLRVRVYGNAGACPRINRVTLISRAFSHRHDFAGLPAIYVSIGRHGHFSRRTRIPANRKPRRYVITGRCGGGNMGVAAHLRVLVAP